MKKVCQSWSSLFRLVPNLPNYGTFSKKTLALNFMQNCICKDLNPFFRRVDESLKEQIFTIIRCKRDVIGPKIGF